ncbi:MAG TPA: glycosyl hydrolase family 28 protein [Bacteroidota bacterium]|nr:glycosyl hydrolase family 28 protein [Bacteroidota bacterium]
MNGGKGAPASPARSNVVGFPHIRNASLALIALIGLRSGAGAASVNVADSGAVGDGRTLNTAALQRAIDGCAAAGGGTVEIPPGDFVTGTLFLRSNIRLVIDAGGVLRGSPRVRDYEASGRRLGLLYAGDAENVTVSGPGRIDGNCGAFMDFLHAKRIDSATALRTRQGVRFREVASGVGDGPAVPGERPYQMMIFSSCRNVVLRDLLITDSPFWTVHCADCDGVLMTGVRIWCNLLVPNNDGADFTSCSNVVVADCDIRTGDDCLVFTGYCRHYDLPGFRNLRHASENIAVANCTLQSRSAAVRIGGFDQNPMRNYTFTNLVIHDSNRGIGIFARDEGSIENMLFSNVVIETRLHTGDWWGTGEPIQISAVRLTKNVKLGRIANIRFRDVICRGESGIVVYGTEENVIENVTFDGVLLHMSNGPLEERAGGNFDLRPVLDPGLQLFAHDIPGLYAGWVRGLAIRDFRLTWDPSVPPFFSHGLEIRHFDGLAIAGFNGTGAPGRSSAFPVMLVHGTHLASGVPAGMIRSRDVR